MKIINTFFKKKKVVTGVDEAKMDQQENETDIASRTEKQYWNIMQNI